MIRLIVGIVIFMLMITTAYAQDNETKTMGKLPYYEIPAYPESYTAESVAARMIDGLGFRYYWATEGLRPEDLAFRPNEEARTTEETIDHLLGLSNVVVHSIQQIANTGTSTEGMTFEEKRTKTLNNLKTASDILKSGKVKLEDCKLVFQNANGTSEYPFWNNINGPIADAMWHCGQVVSFRRSSGNPFNSNVSVFSGRLRN